MITEYSDNYMRNSAQMIGASQTQIQHTISNLKYLLPKIPKTYQGVLQMHIDSLEYHFNYIEEWWKLKGENSETVKQKLNNL